MDAVVRDAGDDQRESVVPGICWFRRVQIRNLISRDRAWPIDSRWRWKLNESKDARSIEIRFTPETKRVSSAEPPCSLSKSDFAAPVCDRYPVLP